MRPLLRCRVAAAVALMALLLVPAVPAAAAGDKQRPDAAAAAAEKARPARRAALSQVGRWGYQLLNLDPDVVAASPFDLVVIDHALAARRRFVRELTAAEVARMQRRPDGSRRLVLAYLSIGEAERYRFYWQQDWYEPGRAPPWLADANVRWEGNWRVRFWDPDWQAYIFAGNATSAAPGAQPASYLARIKAQGFDGVYLDRADVYEDMLAERPSAKADMVRFIRDLAAAARSDAPEFLIVMQNAEELVADKALRRTLDGIAKEDLLFGVEHDAKPNPPDMVADSLAALRRAKADGLRVLTVEYLDDPRAAAQAATTAAREGFVFVNAERLLGALEHPLPAAPIPQSQR